MKKKMKKTKKKKKKKTKKTKCSAHPDHAVIATGKKPLATLNRRRKRRI